MPIGSDSQDVFRKRADDSPFPSEIQTPILKTWLTESGEFRSSEFVEDIAGEIVKLTTDDLPHQKTLLLLHCERYDEHHLPHYVKGGEERAAIMEFRRGMSRDAAERDAAKFYQLEAFLDDIRA